MPREGSVGGAGNQMTDSIAVIKAMDQGIPLNLSWYKSWIIKDDGEDSVADWFSDSSVQELITGLLMLKALAEQHTTHLVQDIMLQRPRVMNELLKNVRCVVSTTDAFLKWKSGEVKGPIGRCVARAVRLAEGVLVDEVESLDILASVAALNTFRTVIFIGDENQRLYRNATSFRGTTHSAPLDDYGVAQRVEREEEDETEEKEEDESEPELAHQQHREVAGWLSGSNTADMQHLTLTHCKRCGHRVTEFISALFKEVRPELANFTSSALAPTTMLQHIFYEGRGWWSSAELATGARGSRAAGRAQQQVVWHEVLYMALLQHIEWDLQDTETDTVMIICFLRRVADPLQKIVKKTCSRAGAAGGGGAFGLCAWLDCRPSPCGA